MLGDGYITKGITYISQYLLPLMWQIEVSYTSTFMSLGGLFSAKTVTAMKYQPRMREVECLLKLKAIKYSLHGAEKQQYAWSWTGGKHRLHFVYIQTIIVFGCIILLDTG